jgi:hypothetical protein
MRFSEAHAPRYTESRWCLTKQSFQFDTHTRTKTTIIIIVKQVMKRLKNTHLSEKRALSIS